MVPHPILGLFSARFQWRGAESHIHGSRDNISLSPEGGGPEAGGNYIVEKGADSPRLRTKNFRLMYMLSDIEPGGGALRFIPGSHRRETPWQPEGVQLRPAGNTRFEECSPEQQSLFVEVTGKAGTAVVFTHDIIHCSWHATDTYRRVMHLTFGEGGADAPMPSAEEEEGDQEEGGGAWLRYLMRERDDFRLPPPGVNINYSEQKLSASSKL